MSEGQIEIIVEESHSGQRLDKYLGCIEEIGTRTRAAHLIEIGSVKINNMIATKNSLVVKTGDRIVCEIPKQTSQTEITKLNIPLEIIFEDQYLLIINKPSGLVVHPAAGHEQDTLVNALVYHIKDLSMKFGENRPGIVHRLDKDTSGLMVVAKNDLVHELLTAKFKARDIHRYYLAVLIGNLLTPFGTIKSYLARHPSDRKRYASVIGSDRKIIREQIKNSNPIGKWAVTDYKVLDRSPKANGLTYVSLKLHTGRTHQIRVHMSELGFPLLADEIYGAKKLNIKNDLQWPRLALHAAELGFDHPITKEVLRFKVPWPDDVYAKIQQLGFDPNPNAAHLR